MIGFIKRRYKLILIGFAAFVIFSVGMIEYTSTTKFCDTCHIMGPYYDSWKNSSHSHVPCLKCHFPPGMDNFVKAKIAGFSQLVQYVTHTYGTKPWAEIDDLACLREGCHATQKLNSEIEFREGIYFNHESHLKEQRRGKTLRCTSCHSQIVQGEHLTVTPTTCYLCHFKNVYDTPQMSDCQECHHLEKIPNQRFDHSFVARNEIPCKQCHGPMYTGTGDVPRQHCYACHAEQPRLDKYGDVDFIHSMHVTRNKVECTECHLEIQHKTQKVSLTQKLPCSSCHEETHGAQKKLFLGFGGSGVEHEPNAMIQSNVHCTGCHLYPKETEKGIIYEAKGGSCNSCHGEGFDTILKSWKDLLKQSIAKADSAIRKGRTEIRGRKVSGDTVGLFEEAEKNLKLVRNAHGVHNIVYSLDLLDHAIRNVNKVLQASGVARRFPGIEEAEEMSSNECAKCHITPPDKNLRVFGKLFPHGKHSRLKDVQCTVCHTDYSDHGKITLKKQDCTVCHGGIEIPHPADWKGKHDEIGRKKSSGCAKCHGKPSCSKCHGLSMPHPDDWPDSHYEVVMEEGDDLCSKCHDGEYCEACHG